MDRYKPKVLPHRYSISFVPVIDKTSSDIKEALLYDPSLTADAATRQKHHSLRTYGRCWCDCDVHEKVATGILHQQYVVEIVIHAWDAADPRNDSLAVGNMRAYPIHSNEDGRACRRCSASVKEFTEMELQALAVKTVVDDYKPIKLSVEQKRDELLQEIHSSIINVVCRNQRTHTTDVSAGTL